MLDLSSKITYTAKNTIAYQMFQSDTDSNAFFVVPAVQLAKGDNGDYSFSLVEYAQKGAGGYCTFETELDIPAADLAEIKDFLVQSYPALKPEPEILTGRFDLSAGGSYVSADAAITGQFSTDPSPFEKNRAVFLLNLDSNALELFKNYFGGNRNAGTFKLYYEYEVPGRLPLVTVVSTFNSSVAYSYERKVVKR